MLPYVWLSLAIVWLWLPPQVSASRLTSRVRVSAGWLLLAVAHAYWTGIITPVAIGATLAFGLLCYVYAHRTRSRWAHMLTTIAVIASSLALMAHVVPGFSNVLIVRDAVLSAGAVPYTLFFNFDKAQIGLLLLALGPPLIPSRAGWAGLLAAALPRLLVVIGIVMVCALWIGRVRFDLKWPEFFPAWAWANLLFTCTAEEALFRGVIQRQLQGPSRSTSETTPRGIAGLLAAGVVFGAAHYTGGTSAIALAASPASVMAGSIGARTESKGRSSRTFC